MSSCFCKKTQWKIYLLVFSHHFGCSQRDANMASPYKYIWMWIGYHLSLEGLRKGYLSKMVYFKKGEGVVPQGRASPHKTLGNWCFRVIDHENPVIPLACITDTLSLLYRQTILILDDVWADYPPSPPRPSKSTLTLTSHLREGEVVSHPETPIDPKFVECPPAPRPLVAPMHKTCYPLV